METLYGVRGAIGTVAEDQRVRGDRERDDEGDPADAPRAADLRRLARREGARSASRSGAVGTVEVGRAARRVLPPKSP